MEFLGDAVLSTLVTEHLYSTYPDKSEGELSKIKSLIVSRRVLGEIALAIDIGRFLFLGAAEQRLDGRKRISILSNAFEALLGAMYLDGGIDVVRPFLAMHLYPHISTFLKDKSYTNYKSKILEMSQEDGLGSPEYRVLGTSGPEHAKTFTVQILVAGVPLGQGSGPNKKVAEQIAAHDAIGNYMSSDKLSQLKGDQQHELLPDGRAAHDRRDRAGDRNKKDRAGQRRI
jgi:ribonuclease-3